MKKPKPPRDYSYLSGHMASYCLCFGKRKGKKKLNSEDEIKLKNQCEMDDTNSIPELPQGEDIVESQDIVESKLDPELLKGLASAHNKLPTFSYRELMDATHNFRLESCIGEGGFGSVYKGQMSNSDQVVAVKKLNLTGLQGDEEFLVEVLMLSLVRHPNLVSLIGYCAEAEQRLLVYEYLPLGSLEDHLHDNTPGEEPLDWNTRLMIAVGAAKGLDYLHNEVSPPVIYRDFKSSNILLGEGFHPKLSDFGLAKFGPSGDNSHVSTRVMGTHGYCAPEYALTGKLTVKSDIYSFGVVLFELITGCRALDPNRGRGRQNLVELVRPVLKDQKNYMKLVDPRMKGQYSEPVLYRAIEVASMCVRELASSRPIMTDVVLALNYLSMHEQEDGSCSINHEGDVATTDGTEVRRRGSMGDLKGFELESTNKGHMTMKSESSVNGMLKKDSDRERAVAEAKMWGESWRAKRRENT